MKEILIRVLAVVLFVSVIACYFYGAHLIMKNEKAHDREMERREYIKFQRDSIELEILKRK
jgi:hypothetical protein